MMYFLKGRIQEKKQKIKKSKNVIFGLKNLMFKDQGIEKMSFYNAFKEISFILFSFKFDFEFISDILLFLSPEAGIDIENV